MTTSKPNPSTSPSTTPHPHAEVLRAVADGKEIQVRVNEYERWSDVSKSSNSCNPIYRPEWQWRVKPEVIPDIEFKEHFCMSYDGSSTWSYNSALVPNVKFTFSGETKKLIEVELI